MKRGWSPQELREHWPLSVEEPSLLAEKTPRSQLGFSVLLKFFQLGSRFPRDRREARRTAVEDLARPRDASPAQFDACDWLSGRGKPGRVPFERGWDAAAPQKLMPPTRWHGSVGRCSRRIPTEPVCRTMPWPGTVSGGLSPHHLTAHRFLVEQTQAT